MAADLLPVEPGKNTRPSPREDKPARQRVRGLLILVFGVALVGLGLFVAPWGLIIDQVVTGYDVSQAASARSSAISGLTSLYIGNLMLFLPFALAVVTLLLAFVQGRIQTLRWVIAVVCVAGALLHALAVRDAFADTAGYGSWMVGAGYLVLGYGGVVIARAAAAAQNTENS